MKAHATRRWLIGTALAIGAYLGMPLSAHAQMGGGALGGQGGGTGFSQGVGGGSTVSASFAGGQATSFSGGGTSFSGGAGGATGIGGGAGAGRLGGAGAAGGILAPTTMNPFRTTYINPLSSGLYTINNTAASAAPGASTGATATNTFGQPLFPTSTTGGFGAAGGAGLRGGVGAAGGAGFGGGGFGGTTGAATNSTGFTTFGVPRAPVYITTLDTSIPRVQHSAPMLNQKLQNMLASSTNLSRFGPVDLAVESGTVTLRGNVKSERDRRLVEGMIRLTPGVREVRNELTISAR